MIRPGSDEKEWGAEGRGRGAGSCRAVSAGSGAGFPWWMDLTPQQTVPGAPNPAAPTSEPCLLLCQVDWASSRLPTSPWLALKQPYIPESQRNLRCRHSLGNLTSSNSPSYNSWIQHTFPETTPAHSTPRGGYQGGRWGSVMHVARGDPDTKNRPSCKTAWDAWAFWGTKEERTHPFGWNGGGLDLESLNGRSRV